MKPSDEQLNELLKRATVPQRSDGYWEAFPKRLAARLTDESQGDARSGSPLVWWAGGVAAACLLVGLGLLVLWPRSAVDPRDQYVKIYREMAALFPHQLREVICDEHGIHLDLADKADLPASPPVLLTLCTKSQPCREIITFSGQQVRVDGDTCEVLSDGSGHILVVGSHFVWSSEKGRDLGGVSPRFNKIEAQRL